MRILPAGLQAHLDSGTTTLCHCWRVTLKSGERLGFTDHDSVLVFDGTSFEASAGFTGSEIETSLGLAIDNLEVRGALQSARLDEARLKAGDFDHAAIEIWRVNWQNAAMRLLLHKGHLGEVTFGAGAFEAELRGLAHLMNQPKGRIYQFGCDALLGDGRCGVNLNTVAFQASGTVASVGAATLTLNGIGFADDWATRGTVAFTSGAGNGRSLPIKRHRFSGGITQLDFAVNFPFAVAPGNSVTVRAGCDKQFATCKNKFANTVNFRGFPHMPGTDFVMAYPVPGDATNNGGKRG